MSGWVVVTEPYVGFTADLGGISLDVEAESDAPDARWLARVCRPEQVLYESAAIFPTWEEAAAESVRVVRAATVIA